MTSIPFNVYLAGEIHSDWRGELARATAAEDLPVRFSAPVCDHPASDDAGERVMGEQPSAFWRDHTAARINGVRIRRGIDEADLVIVRFGEQYKQWNAAFDAGWAAASGTPYATFYEDAGYDHALKEINAAAVATCRSGKQVLALLRYLCTQD